MASILLLSLFVLILIIKLVLRKKPQVLPGFLWIIIGVLFIAFTAAAVYFGLIKEGNTSLVGYGSISWLYVTAGISGWMFLLWGPNEQADKILKWIAGIVWLPIIVIAAMSANHIDDKFNHVFYDGPKFRIEKKPLVMYLITLPRVAVKHGWQETYYQLHSEFNRFEQKDVDSAQLVEIAADSIQVSLYHHRDSAKHIPNPLVVGLRYEPR